MLGFNPAEAREGFKSRHYLSDWYSMNCAFQHGFYALRFDKVKRINEEYKIL